MRETVFLLLSSFALSFVLCIVEIPILRKIGAGQNILHYVKEHANKHGTPTMGGIGFVLAAIAVALAFCGVEDKPFLVCIAVGGGYMLVGFLDDLLKKLRRDNLGLRAYQKVAFQIIVALLAATFCCLNGLTVVKIPFTPYSVDLGWGMFPVAVFVLIATVNSVNLTDGLDGLAGSVSAVYFLVFALLIMAQQGRTALSDLSFSLVGALCAYLIFNTNRASVFMGDTGSLSLGGFASCVALFSQNALFIPFVGGMFMLSSISVIIQVIYYKKTGKRVFLMAPIHHHFQQRGHSEAKIAYAYSVVTGLIGLLALCSCVL